MFEKMVDRPTLEVSPEELAAATIGGALAAEKLPQPLAQEVRESRGGVLRTPFLDVEIGPGGCVYIPRGFVYEAVTTSKRQSNYLKATVAALSWADLLTHGLQALLEAEFARGGDRGGGDSFQWRWARKEHGQDKEALWRALRADLRAALDRGRSGQLRAAVPLGSQTLRLGFLREEALREQLPPTQPPVLSEHPSGGQSSADETEGRGHTGREYQAQKTGEEQGQEVDDQKEEAKQRTDPHIKAARVPARHEQLLALAAAPPVLIDAPPSVEVFGAALRSDLEPGVGQMDVRDFAEFASDLLKATQFETAARPKMRPRYSPSPSGTASYEYARERHSCSEL
eukprot:SAG11_NODE_7026_length_1206_cov_1.284553_1_plen_342_part_00